MIRMSKMLSAALALVMSAAAAYAASPGEPAGEKVPPDNLTGRVCSVDGCGIAGVVVSDGDLCTVTDAEGRYAMLSDKRCGYLFVSIPSGYEAQTGPDMIPLFFQRLSADVEIVERHDFTLNPVDNDRFMLIAATDHHVADRQSRDLAQFRWERGFFADVRQLAESANRPVYSVCMGDMSWDEYWYRCGYTIADYRRELSLNGYPTPVFHAMGNHDNDPYRADDWLASEAYRDAIGPTYYSFNIGRVHFVVLDNIVYRNSGGGQGRIGRLDYSEEIDSGQLAWLERDLALVADRSAPLVVVMHAPLYGWCNRDGSIACVKAMAGADDLIELLEGFGDVYVISGHSHVNQRTKHPETGIHEINVAATSGTWWWTGTYHDAGFDVNICMDGSPGGYEVFSFDGRDVEWYYKGIGIHGNCMFRAYDMNEVLENEIIAAAGEDFSPSGSSGGIEDGYGLNDILLNVWEWEPGWTIRVTEEGREIEGVRVYGKDPMHKIAYIGRTAPFQTRYNCHMWKYRASRPDSTVVIEVTDLFGHTRTEVMHRPKAFSVTMR